MSNVRGDILIKKLRRERGLTQIQLSEGICSTDTLSRIERGERVPSRWVFEQLMQRLGENPKNYFTDVVTTEDKKIADLKSELRDLLYVSLHDLPSIKSDQCNRKRIDELIEKMEQDKAFVTKENQQFLMRSKASLALVLENYDDVYKYAMEALRVTRPNFDEDKIEEYALSLDEIWLVNQVAIAHFHFGSIEKSTDIFFELQVAIEKRYIDGDEMIYTYSTLLYNLSKNLGILKRYEECLDICDKGIDWCRKHRDSFHHPLLLATKAFCLFMFDEREEGLTLLKRAYALFIGLERHMELLQARSYAEKEFDVIISSIEISDNADKK